MVAFERGKRRSRKLRRAHREDAPDGFLAEPPQRELDYGRRRSIEPLEVVDRAHDLRFAGQSAQKREKSGSDDTTFGRPCRSGAEERGVETDPLRLGQSREELVGHVAEEIREPREAKPGFRLGRPRDQHAGAVRAGTLDRRLPQRRLADSRLAADRERAGLLGGQEELDGPQLRLAPDQARHDQRLCAVRPADASGRARFTSRADCVWAGEATTQEEGRKCRRSPMPTMSTTPRAGRASPQSCCTRSGSSGSSRQSRTSPTATRSTTSRAACSAGRTGLGGCGIS